MAHFLITLAIAAVSHCSGVLWQPPHSHEPDISSVLCITTVLALLMHPATIEKKCGFGARRHLWAFAYMLQCLLVQYLVVILTWNAFDQMCDSFSPKESNVSFFYRLITATAMLCYAILSWRHTSRNVITSTVYAEYVEQLENAQIMPNRKNIPVATIMGDYIQRVSICSDPVDIDN